MKRLIACLCVLLLLTAAACAETRERTVIVEGSEETITETLYVSGQGFSVWYDAEWLTLNDGGQRLLLYAAGLNDPQFALEIMTPAAAGTGAWEFISTRSADDTVVRFEDLESGAEMAWFFLADESDPAVLHGYYLVTMDMDEEDPAAPWVAAAATFPIEAGDGAGPRFTEVMRTVSFGGAQAVAAQPAMPVRAAWAEENTNTLTAYLSWNLIGSDAWVLFTAEEEVTDFRICELTMQFTGDGEYTFHEDEVFALDTLWPTQPLIAGLDFPGDMPCWGIRYTDAAGEEHRFTVGISGEDGEIILTPY